MGAPGGHSQPLTRADRLVLGALFVSFAVGAALDFFWLRPPLASLLDMSDQQSHVESVVAFPSLGLELYRTPIADFVHPDGDSSTIVIGGRRRRTLRAR
jgi:hypothetical protein